MGYYHDLTIQTIIAHVIPRDNTPGSFCYISNPPGQTFKYPPWTSVCYTPGVESGQTFTHTPTGTYFQTPPWHLSLERGVVLDITIEKKFLTVTITALGSTIEVSMNLKQMR